MKMHRLLTILLAVAVAAPSVVMAQEETRERERQEAMRRVQEAQHRLQAALENLQKSRSDEANAALREAIEAVRMAQRNMRVDELSDLYGRLNITVTPGDNVGRVLYVGEGRPKMGVILQSSGGGSRTDSIGVVLQGVTPGGPADEAGLKAGDIIVRANGQVVARVNRQDGAPDDKLVKIIEGLEEGDTLVVTYRRGDRTSTANVAVRVMEPLSYAFSYRGDSLLRGQLLEEFAAPNIEFHAPELVREPRELAFEPSVLAWSLGRGWMNMELAELDPDLGSYFGTTEGLLVVRPPRDEGTQFKSGDVILKIGDRVPTSPSHAMRIMRAYEPGETMSIEIMRNRQRQTIQVAVPERDRGFFWEGRR
jgi:C-terminal processing protease CtpA/Prc